MKSPVNTKVCFRYKWQIILELARAEKTLLTHLSLGVAGFRIRWIKILKDVFRDPSPFCLGFMLCQSLPSHDLKKIATSSFLISTKRLSLSLEGRGFPGGAPGKEPACQCRRLKSHRFDP